MGITVPIEESGGVFPKFRTPRLKSPAEGLNLLSVSNHQSFKDDGGFGSPPGHEIVQKHVDQGFGELFSDQASAERALGSPVTPAPLGCISKQREDGSYKHRVIMDLRANAVNDAVATPERQVLPTVFHHGRDIAWLADVLPQMGSDSVLATMVLYFKDAFMGIPLHPAERPYKTCAVDRPCHRHRPIRTFLGTRFKVRTVSPT